MDFVEDVTQWREPKYCFIPLCSNNSRKNPKITFFTIRKELKESWCQLVNRRCPKRTIFCCEDHIDVEHDLKNYEQFVAGAVPRLKLNVKLKNIPEESSAGLTLNQNKQLPRVSRLRGHQKKHKKEIHQGKGPHRCELPRALNCLNPSLEVEEDTENYIRYKIMVLEHGQKVRLRLKKGIVPHIFQRQDKKKSGPPQETKAVINRKNRLKRKDLVEEALTETALTDVEEKGIPEVDLGKAPAKETKLRETETLQADINQTVKIKVEECEENDTDSIYNCDNCSHSIVGFRYTCLECENYDLCRDCETDMTHPEHCMLRIPESRPKGDIQSILEAVGDKIRSLSEELKQNQIALDEVKVEVDFDDPTAMDPLTSPQSGAQLEAADVICDVLTSDVTPRHETRSEATSDTAPSVARRKHSEPPERLARKRLQPQTVPATKTPIVLLKKLNLTDIDKQNPRGKTKRRKRRHVEEDIDQELKETWLDEDILKEENSLFDVTTSSQATTVRQGPL